MSKANHPLLTLLTYSSITLTVLLWSGSVKSSSLFDKYVVTLEGVALPSKNPEITERFYRDKLGFLPYPEKTEEKSNRKELSWPDGKRLSFSETSPIVLLRVRNGFEKLHQSLKDNSQDKVRSLASEEDSSTQPLVRVSEIFPAKFAKQFKIEDPDGNSLLFYSGKPKILSLTEKKLGRKTRNN